MKYLAYLTTHTYAELPADVREEISAEEYNQRLRTVGQMAGGVALPQTLRGAYRTAIARRKKPVRAPLWLVAASWLLTLGIGLAWASERPVVRYVHLPSGTEPERITEYRTDTVERRIYRTDTVFAPAPRRPLPLLVRDTVYLSAQPPPSPARTVRLNEASLSLLVGSVAEE